jgi:hypothetical protein
MHSKASIQAFTCIETEATTGIRLWVKFRTLRTDLERISRAIQSSFGHKFRGEDAQISSSCFYCIFHTVLANFLAQESRQAVQHLLLGQPYNCTDFCHINQGAFLGLFIRSFVEETLR